jgi:hypothetical protein
MILERCGPPNARLRSGTTILHAIVTMGDHVTAEERVAFAAAALDAGARLDLRDGLLMSTPLGWACRWGREETRAPLPRTRRRPRGARRRALGHAACLGREERASRDRRPVTRTPAVMTGRLVGGRRKPAPLLVAA